MVGGRRDTPEGAVAPPDPVSTECHVSIALAYLWKLRKEADGLGEAKGEVGYSHQGINQISGEKKRGTGRSGPVRIVRHLPS